MGPGHPSAAPTGAASVLTAARRELGPRRGGEEAGPSSAVKAARLPLAPVAPGPPASQSLPLPPTRCSGRANPPTHPPALSRRPEPRRQAPLLDARSPLGSPANLRPAPDEGEDVWNPRFCSQDPHVPHPNRVLVPFLHRPLSHTPDPAALACPAPDPTRVPRRLPHDLLHATRAPAPTSTRPRQAHQYGCRPDPPPKSRRPST